MPTHSSICYILYQLHSTSISNRDLYYRSHTPDWSRMRNMHLKKIYITRKKWPKKVRSEDIYILTGVSKWSKIIARKRLSWFEHLTRLPDETPAKRAMNFALKPYLRPIGAPKTTWISIIKKQLKGLNFNLQEANELAQDRKLWQKLMMTKCAV